MGILYIIGNGFDLHFGLKTRVEDFKQCLNVRTTFDGVNALDALEYHGVNWGKYEDSLADIDIDSFDEYLVYPDYLSDHEYDRDGGIFEMEERVGSIKQCIAEALQMMIKKANSQLTCQSKCKSFFNEGDAILSFNYTSTIEELFDVPPTIPILHIHGFCKNKTELVFGYNEEHYYLNATVSNKIDRYDDEYNAYDGDFYIDEQKRVVQEFYQSLKKKKRLDLLVKFLSEIDVKEVVVLGHSMSNVDKDYMEMIDRVLSPEIWRVSVYRSDPTDQQLNTYSFSHRIIRISINDII